MYDVQQKQTKQSLQVKLAQFLNKFKDSITLPEFKCIRDMSLGMLKSQSVICLQIAISLGENVVAKKVVERFTRHLNKKNFGLKLQSMIIAHQCREFDQDTAIIVDDSDLLKPSAKCMEGLQKVRDGSTGTHDQLGYNLLNIIAYRDYIEGYEIKPVSSDLIAIDMEQDSISQITEDRIVEIALASGNKGVYVFDRGYDRRHLFPFLQQNALNYVMRSKGIRGLIIDGEEKRFLEVAKSVTLGQKHKMKDSKQHMKCGIKRVSIRLNPHPVKHPETIDTWLVVAQYSPDENGREGFFYLFCDFPAQAKLTESEIITKALTMYRMRWKIEEVHRHMKQAYGWEKMQLTSYTRLQNMNQVLLLTMCYLYSLKKFAGKYLEAFPAIMKYTNKTWKRIYAFAYYKITLLVAVCFSPVTRFDISPHNGKWQEGEQLILPCLKNGGM